MLIREGEQETELVVVLISGLNRRMFQVFKDFRRKIMFS